ncbi:MAG: copper chaperone PCu(A)C [Pseudomonadota bacterium]
MLKQTLFTAALTGLAVLTALPAAAHDFKAGDIVIDHPWSRPTIPNRPSAGYFGLENTGEAADRLLSASSPAFGRVELHQTSETDGVMRMVKQDAVPIPAGETLSFEPGGYHVMLFDAVEQLAEGDRFPLELVFENAGAVTVELVVKRRAPKKGEMDHSGHGSHGEHGGHGHGHGDATTN